MSDLKILCFCANTCQPSKTRTLIDRAAATLLKRHGLESETIDLVGLLGDLFASSRPRESMAVAALVGRIEQADALIVGTPVYKGSYTGLFKHIFDLVDQYALVNKPVLLAANGGGTRHSLVVEHQLRPLFGFFEAATVPTGIYASELDFTDGALTSGPLQQRLDCAIDQLVRLIRQPVLAAAE